MGLEVIENNKTYLNIVKGTLVQKVDEGTEGAKKRKYETSDGGTGEKWELNYKSVSGYLESMNFKSSDYGEQFVLELRDGDDLFSLQIPVDGKYFADFAKKVSNVYFDVDFSLSPYDFETQDGKKRAGITIRQEGEKIANYFYDVKAKKNLHGFPSPEGDTKKYDKDDWKMYFINVKKFLKAHVQSLELPSNIEVEAETVSSNTQDDF